MINMDPGPWYEHSGPSIQEVKIGLKSFINNYSKKYKLSCCNYEKIISDAIIDEIGNEDDNEYPFGSYRGYHTFVKPNYAKKSSKKLMKKKRKKH